MACQSTQHPLRSYICPLATDLILPPAAMPGSIARRNGDAVMAGKLKYAGTAPCAADLGRAVPRPPQASRGGRATVLPETAVSGESPLWPRPCIIGVKLDKEREKERDKE